MTGYACEKVGDIMNKEIELIITTGGVFQKGVHFDGALYDNIEECPCIVATEKDVTTVVPMSQVLMVQHGKA